MNNKNLSLEEIRKLWDQFQAGSNVAFTTLYEHFLPKLKTVAYSHTKDMCAAEDLAQEALTEVFTKGSNITIDSSLKGYLSMIVLNKHRKQFKPKNRPNVSANEDLLKDLHLEDSNISDFINQESSNQVVMKIWQIAEQVLTFNEHFVFSKIYVEEKGVKDIAALMDKSEENIRQFKAAAKRKLKNNREIIRLRDSLRA